MASKLIDTTFKVVVIFVFLFSLMFSFAGMMPYGRAVDLRVADDIRKHKKFVLRLKLYFVATAGILLSAGFIFAVWGILVHKS